MIRTRAFIIVTVFLLSACAHHQKLPPEEFYHVYVAGQVEDGLHVLIV